MGNEFNDKQKDLRKVLGSLSKSKDEIQVTTGISSAEMENTGIWAIDRLTKGVPRGQFTHIAGPANVGKTTLMYGLIGSMQKQGKTCLLIPNERRYNAEWAKRNGVDPNTLNIAYSKTIEGCLDVIISVAKSGTCDLLAVDTITGIASLGETENKKGELSVGDDQMALIPRRLSKFFRIASPYVFDSKMITLLINQIRKDLGSFIVRDTSTGGNALEHAKSLDVFLRRSKKADWPENGHLIHATLLKCTHSIFATEGDVTTFNFFHGKGFDNDYDVVYHARSENLIKSSGRGKYVYTPEKGDPVEVSCTKDKIDHTMKNILKEKGLIEELKIKLEKTEIKNVGEVEKINLEKDE